MLSFLKIKQIKLKYILIRFFLRYKSKAYNCSIGIKLFTLGFAKLVSTLKLDKPKN